MVEGGEELGVAPAEPEYFLQVRQEGGKVVRLACLLPRLLGIALSGEFTGFFAGALVWELGFTVAAILALRRGPRPG